MPRPAQVSSRVTSVVVACGLLAASLTGCGGGEPTLTVTPKAGLSDTTLHVRVDGAAGDRVRLTTKDAERHQWVATVPVPEGGTGDVGPTLTDRLARPGRLGWVFVPPRRWTMTATLLDDDKTVASQTVVRRQPVQDGLATETKIRPTNEAGLYGDLFVPTRPRAGATAVLLIGGSEGGTYMDGAAALLAAHGHVALVAGYFAGGFDMPGKLKELANIPLEQFHAGLRRLATVPGVNASRIEVVGLSRGSEAALLTAVTWPKEVHDVVASVPSSVVNAAVGDLDAPAWTLGGKPLPYTKVRGNPDASDNPSAKIAVGRTRGQLLLICAGVDQVWPSCPYAEAIHAAVPGRSKVLTYLDAGHLAGLLVPNVPLTLDRTPQGSPYGGIPSADAAARRAMWPKVLAFLNRTSPD